MPDELLAAVLADPDSQTVPQVYADELIRRGDPRGELIVVEMALAGPLSIRKRAELTAHRSALRRDHAATWWPYALSGFRTRGGFIRSVRGSWAQLSAAADRLFAAEPVTQVEVGDVDEDIAAQLAEAPWLARVRHLILRGDLGGGAFAVVCASPHLAGLQELNVTATALDAAALEGLGDHLSECRTLVLTGNEIGDAGIAALRTWTHVTGLETLYLSGCDLSDRGVAMLLDGTPLTRLAKLCLSNNELEDVGHTISARAAAVPALAHLELIATNLGRGGVEALLAALPRLHRLDVRRNNIGTDVFAAHGARVRAG